MKINQSLLEPEVLLWDYFECKRERHKRKGGGRRRFIRFEKNGGRRRERRRKTTTEGEELADLPLDFIENSESSRLTSMRWLFFMPGDFLTNNLFVSACVSTLLVGFNFSYTGNIWTRRHQTVDLWEPNAGFNGVCEVEEEECIVSLWN